MKHSYVFVLGPLVLGIYITLHPFKLTGNLFAHVAGKFKVTWAFSMM